ncbi:hypothetical protein M0Q97_00995 [Candidatus Dojkabacteria bacterium]|jgi:hypothetical protein|nr:hypothetical protein [Candidatus Dojkabacteria bacterium]
MARPRKKDKKTTLSITIDSELNMMLEKYLIDIKLSKSEYIEYLIKKEKK